MTVPKFDIFSSKWLSSSDFQKTLYLTDRQTNKTPLAEENMLF